DRSILACLAWPGRAHLRGNGDTTTDNEESPMHRLRILGLSASIATLLAAPAFAQDGDTASGKRFSVVGSATVLQPDSDPLSGARSEEHTSELQSRENLVCRL